MALNSCGGEEWGEVGQLRIVLWRDGDQGCDFNGSSARVVSVSVDLSNLVLRRLWNC